MLFANLLSFLQSGRFPVFNLFIFIFYLFLIILNYQLLHTHFILQLSNFPTKKSCAKQYHHKAWK